MSVENSNATFNYLIKCWPVSICIVTCANNPLHIVVYIYRQEKWPHFQNVAHDLTPLLYVRLRIQFSQQRHPRF
jgi:hypothetical protein